MISAPWLAEKAFFPTEMLRSPHLPFTAQRGTKALILNEVSVFLKCQESQ